MRLAMHTRFRRCSLFVALAVCGFQAMSQSQGAPDWAQPPSRNFPVVGGNLGNQRHSTLRQIGRSTVSRVGGAWMVHLEEGSTIGNMQATPVVVDGVMYITTGPNNGTSRKSITTSGITTTAHRHCWPTSCSRAGPGAFSSTQGRPAFSTSSIV